MRRDTFLKSMAARAAAGALPHTAWANANLKMMIPANPGGGWDTTGRALGNALRDAGVAASVTFENKGGAAGAIGAGLSDFLGGYAVWVLPTMVLKGLWAFIAGTIAYKLLPNFKYSWLVGAIVGGIAHIIGYTLVKIPLYGTVVAFGEMFTLSMQTIAGIVLGGVVYTILVQSPAIRTLKAKFA